MVSVINSHENDYVALITYVKSCIPNIALGLKLMMVKFCTQVYNWIRGNLSIMANLNRAISPVPQCPSQPQNRLPHG